MTRGEEFVRVLRMFRFVREQPPGSNSSDFIDYALRRAGLRPEVMQAQNKAWCAAGLTAIASEWFGAAWPLPVDASVMTIYRACERAHMLRDTPEVGSLFFVWNEKRQRYAHIGAIAAPPNVTLSANTSKPGDTNPETQREGWGLFEKPWPFGPRDRFATWW